ncbi:hypothetical protein GF412_02100 [Candidatus Micrarchaeota archaeon]|nr:hypothetical protein [Candidatus Micrarchaeota archaeon]MBD3417754.1 hypothetical protein [Candidatus Micrarchaeota archaeon]
MCRICEVASSNAEYLGLLRKMVEEDKARLKTTNEFLDKLPSLSHNLYTSLKWPTKLSTPLFEARAAFAVPHKYFQQLILDGEKMGNHFAHGATRSVFFSGKRLVLLSKTVGQEAGRPFLSSFLFTHFEPNEYEVAYDGKDMKIAVDAEKPLKNLITGKVEKKKIHFNFFHQNLEGRIISKQQAMQSSYVKKTLGKRGNVRNLFASADLEGYVVSVSHFSPHPFMLRMHKEFGFDSFRHFQEHVLDYFREHLNLS